jgi:hypothetical protein
MLVLKLTRIPEEALGIYGRDRTGDGLKDILPERMRFLHPSAAPSFIKHKLDKIRVSDMFRSAEASLNAMQNKSGVQPPAYSAHTYGLAVDVDVSNTLRANRWKYPDLLAFMAENQWYCYRRDGARGREDWHFTFLGPDPQAILAELDPRPWLGRRTWSRAAEMAIQQRYAGKFSMDTRDVQEALIRMRLYHGAVDGKLGPLSMRAIQLFARTWRLPADASAPRFQRVLSYVSAETAIVEAA